MNIENKYYNAKQMKSASPEEALEEFLGVPALEQEKGDWSVSHLVPPRHGSDDRQGVQGVETSHQAGV